MTSITATTVLRRLAIVAAMGVSPLSWANTQVLYDRAAAPQDNTYDPTKPGWLAAGFLGLTPAVTDSGTDVTPSVFVGESGYGGYSNHKFRFTFSPLDVRTEALVNPSFPGLDRDTGYSLSLGFKVTDETHTGNSNRAGFSITLIGDDLQGIELGFQGNSIFAQNPSFTAGETNTSSDIATRLASYQRWQLGVTGGSYVLSQGGTTFLSGALRNYSAYSGLGQDAYRTPNFLFFGDNTSSAKANFSIDYAAITTAPVPEPRTYALLLAGLVLLGAASRRHIRP